MDLTDGKILEEANTPFTGIDLIALERIEQIEKHGYDLKKDRQYCSKGQLYGAAIYCLTENELYYPLNWDSSFKEKIEKKKAIMSHVEFEIEMSKIAGALLASNIDVLLPEPELLPTPIALPSIQQSYKVKYPFLSDSFYSKEDEVLNIFNRLVDMCVLKNDHYSNGEFLNAYFNLDEEEEVLSEIYNILSKIIFDFGAYKFYLNSLIGKHNDPEFFNLTGLQVIHREYFGCGYAISWNKEINKYEFAHMQEEKY